MIDSRAVIMKVREMELDDCTSCSVSITEDTDKQWIVANVYADCCGNVDCRTCRGTGRKWARLEHWHLLCYASADDPYGEPVAKKTKKAKSTPSPQGWDEEED